jgi:hypothetical protein
MYGLCSGLEKIRNVMKDRVARQVATQTVVARAFNGTGLVTAYASSNASESLETKIVQLAAQVSAGHLYRVQVRYTIWSDDTVGHLWDSKLYYTTDGTDPSYLSAFLHQMGDVTDPNTSGATIQKDYVNEGYYTATADGMLKVLFAFWSSSPSPGVRMWARTLNPITMTVEDLGPDPGATGTFF